MKKIHLVLPMGGGGTRFGDKGFDLPKPLIEIAGKPFFFWATQSIVKFVDIEDLIYVVLQEHVNQYEIDKRIHEFYPNAKICVIPQILNGAVLTCLEGVRLINDDRPILFNDCDHAFICRDFYSYCKKGEFKDIDGALLTFKSNNPNYSYVVFGKDGKVNGTVEKEVAGEEAICGAFFFRSKELFSLSAEAYLKNCNYTEFFISGVYNEMVRKGKWISTFGLTEHISFGTPAEYDLALNDERFGQLI